MFKKNTYFALLFLISFLFLLGTNIYKGFTVNVNTSSFSTKSKSDVSSFTNSNDDQTNDFLLEDNDNEDEDDSKVNPSQPLANYSSNNVFNNKNRVSFFVTRQAHRAFLPIAICLLGHNFRI